jgi:hypothetical protein
MSCLEFLVLRDALKLSPAPKKSPNGDFSNLTYLLLEVPLICFDLCWNLSIFHIINQLLRVVEWDCGQVDSAFLCVSHNFVAPFYILKVVIFLVLAPLQGITRPRSRNFESGLRCSARSSSLSIVGIAQPERPQVAPSLSPSSVAC